VNVLGVWVIQFHTVIFKAQSIFPYITELMKPGKKKRMKRT